ncbi:SHOCT domain-containing protein [Promicromonospora sp. NPDC090134]|uniref:SHOCT domain-containing protein n=1 Tax=Promicromonospora sp. NPDC090134 TaxID=3364408 RepID=UPI00381032B9
MCTAACHHGRSEAPSAPPQASGGADVVEQIRKLKELHEAGILTDAEFSTKKTELLDRL